MIFRGVGSGGGQAVVIERVCSASATTSRPFCYRVEVGVNDKGKMFSHPSNRTPIFKCWPPGLTEPHPWTISLAQLCFAAWRFSSEGSYT